MAAEFLNTSFDIYKLLDSIPEVNVNLDVSDLTGQEMDFLSGYYVPSSGPSHEEKYDEDLDDVDTNNNAEGAKKEIALNSTFEDMINETYEAMMKTEENTNPATTVIKPLPSDQACQGPLARSSPKITKFKLIQPIPAPAPRLLHYVPGILVKSPSLITSTHLSGRLVPAVAPSQRIARIKKAPSGSSSPDIFSPRSYTWRGFEGGLKINPIMKQSCSSPRLLSTIKLKAPPRKLLPKTILGLNQHIFSKVSLFRAISHVSLLKPCPSIIKRAADKNREIKPKTLKIKVERIPVGSPSGWITREDPKKMKKNELERERRLEMTIYRENLRKLLPRTKQRVKVPSVAVLIAAKSHCEKLQAQMYELEVMKIREERRNETLVWRLTRLKYQLDIV